MSNHPPVYVPTADELLAAWNELPRLREQLEAARKALDVIANDRIGFRTYSEVFAYAKHALDGVSTPATSPDQ